MSSSAILIVEDNPTTRKAVRLTLESEGYEVLEAEDARTALHLMETASPSLVVQDLLLPDMDGTELTQRLREISGQRAVPIIALSGFASLITKNGAAAADASLLKPVEPARLLEVVCSFLPVAGKPTENLGRGRLILLADDDPVQLKLARLRLGFAGFEVVTSVDGAEALALARQRRPSLILSDVLMPNLDGFELCLAVRADPALAGIPVVLLSAHYNDRSDTELARKVGANALLVRTPDFQAVLDAVSAALDKRPRPRAAESSDTLRDEHRIRMTQQLKRQASANAELMQRSALQAAQLSILGAVADALTRTSDIDTTLGEVLTACLDAGGISKGALLRLDGNGQLTLTHAVGFSDGERATLGESISGQLLELVVGGQPAIRSERAGLLVPLMAPADGGCTGALFLGSNVENMTDQDLFAFGRAIGAYIGQASSLASAFTRVNVTADASRLLSASLKLDETLLSVAGLMTSRLADICEIAVADHAGQLHRMFSVRDDAPREAIVRALHRHCADATAVDPASVAFSGAAAQIVFDLEDESVTAAARDPEHAQLLKALDVRSRMLVPLVVNNRVRGSFALGRFGSARRFAASDLDLSKDLADRIAVAVENAQLYRAVEEAGRAKDDFLATVSHELRTPLNSILGWTVMVRARSQDQLLVERGLGIVERNARAQAKLIEDILDVSRIVSGKMSLNTRMMEIGAVVQAAVDVVFPAATAKQIAIDVECDAAVGMVLGDPERFQQVMWNLLSNSVKFSPPGSRVDVSVTRRRSVVEIRVADTGKGIHADLLPFVFERFRQGDTSITRADGGLGLGLALVRHLVDLHGGTVGIASDGVGRGTAVTITLPAADLNAEAPVARGAVTGSDPLGLDGLRVLVVEDEEDARELISVLLTTYGVVVFAAANAAEAMAALETFGPAVIISDIGMPGEDGFSFLTRARAICSVPAVALTAYASADDRARTRAAGYQVHLSKPIEPAKLLDAVARLAATARAVSG